MIRLRHFSAAGPRAALARGRHHRIRGNQCAAPPKSIDEIIEYIQRDNLFQYPTEREVSRLTRAWHKRLVALDNEKLVFELANAPVEVAKQINVFFSRLREQNDEIAVWSEQTIAKLKQVLTK